MFTSVDKLDFVRTKIEYVKKKKKSKTLRRTAVADYKRYILQVFELSWSSRFVAGERADGVQSKSWTGAKYCRPYTDRS